MKILILADGRAVHTARFMKGMHDAGAEVLLASLEPGPEVEVRLKIKTPFNALAYYFAASEIKKLVKTFNPDIVNPHFASGYGFTVAASGVNKNKPMALHCLGSDILISPKKSFLHRYRVVSALKAAGEIFADSQYISGEIKRLHEESRVNIVPWGVEESILQIYLKKQDVKIDVGRPLKIIVPRPHSKIYNNLFIVESLNSLLLEKKISLTFPAWGNDFELFRRSTAGGLPDGVINFYDFQERRNYYKLLRGFDFYFSAALSDSSPASLLDAMGAGLFPIVGDIPGVREWVNDENGILFDPRSGDSLRKAVELVFSGKFNFGMILLKNHRRVRSEALFSDNIRDTIRIMEGMIAVAR